MKRREARELLFALIYEAGFHCCNIDAPPPQSNSEDVRQAVDGINQSQADGNVNAEHDINESENVGETNKTGDINSDAGAAHTGNPEDTDIAHDRARREEIYALAAECREFEGDAYVKEIFFDIGNKLEVIDTKIAAHSVGWKSDRLSKVSQAIMRLCVYEMLYRNDIPYNISINEAVELAKKFDHENAPKFINGVVNAIADKEGLKKKL